MSLAKTAVSKGLLYTSVAPESMKRCMKGYTRKGKKEGTKGCVREGMREGMNVL